MRCLSVSVCLSLARIAVCAVRRSLIRAVNDLSDALSLTKIKLEFSGASLCFGLLVRSRRGRALHVARLDCTALQVDDKMFVANVGDSECVLCRETKDGKWEAIPLSSAAPFLSAGSVFVA